MTSLARGTVLAHVDIFAAGIIGKIAEDRTCA